MTDDLFKGRDKDYWFQAMLDFCADENIPALTIEEFDKLWNLNNTKD